MKYKAFFTDNSIYATEAKNNMSSAKSFSSVDDKNKNVSIGDFYEHIKD